MVHFLLNQFIFPHMVHFLLTQSIFSSYSPLSSHSVHIFSSSYSPLFFHSVHILLIQSTFISLRPYSPLVVFTVFMYSDLYLPQLSSLCLHVFWSLSALVVFTLSSCVLIPLSSIVVITFSLLCSDFSHRLGSLFPWFIPIPRLFVFILSIIHSDPSALHSKKFP